MKRTLLCGLLALMLCALVPLSALAMPGDYTVSYMYVNTANGGALNLRASQTVNSKCLVQIPNGTLLMLYNYQAGDTWVLCNYGAYQGYVMSRYLNVNAPVVTPTETPSTDTTATQIKNQFKAMKAANYYVTVVPSTPTGFVNLRWAPSKGEPVLSICYANKTLRVIAETSTWCQVYDEVNNVCGFMMRSFLQYAGQVPSGSVTPPPIGQGVTVLGN